MPGVGARDAGVASTIEVVVAVLVFVLVLSAYFSVVAQSFRPVDRDLASPSQSVLLSTLLLSEPGRLDDDTAGGNTSWESFPASGAAASGEFTIQDNLTGIGFARESAGYGIVDRAKIEAMRNVTYETARRLLGLTELGLHFSLEVRTAAGERILDYGPAPRSESEVFSFTRVASLDQVNTSVVPVDFPVDEKLVINEVMYHPVNEVSGSDAESQYEWLELYNPNQNAVNVSGWHILNDNPNNGNNRDPSADNELVAWDAGGTLTIPPDGYALVVGTDSLVYDYFVVDDDSVRLKMGFASLTDKGLKPHGEGGQGQGNQGGERIELVDGDGRTVEFLEYDSSWGGFNPNADDNFTMARIDPYGDANDPANWEDSDSSLGTGPGGGGTAGQANSARTFRRNRTRVLLTMQAFPSARSSAAVRVNEVMHDPPSGAADEEWVELYNPLDRAINVSGWELGDDVQEGTLGGTGPRGAVVPGKGYAVVAADGASAAVTSAFDVHDDAVILETSTSTLGDGLDADDVLTVRDAEIGKERDRFDWASPGGADAGGGETLERIDPLGPGEMSNIAVSLTDDGLDGTPGRINSRTAS